MLQRIQTLFLAIAATFFATYPMSKTATITMVEESLDFFPNQQLSIWAYCLAGLVAIAIFLFKNRKWQRKISLFCVGASLALFAISLLKLQSQRETYEQATELSYGIGFWLPLLGMIALFMALRGINKDEELVRSMDRLR